MDKRTALALVAGIVTFVASCALLSVGGQLAVTLLGLPAGAGLVTAAVGIGGGLVAAGIMVTAARA